MTVRLLLGARASVLGFVAVNSAVQIVFLALIIFFACGLVAAYAYAVLSMTGIGSLGKIRQRRKIRRELHHDELKKIV